MIIKDINTACKNSIPEIKQLFTPTLFIDEVPLVNNRQEAIHQHVIHVQQQKKQCIIFY